VQVAPSACTAGRRTGGRAGRRFSDGQLADTTARGRFRGRRRARSRSELAGAGKTPNEEGRRDYCWNLHLRGYFAGLMPADQSRVGFIP